MHDGLGPSDVLVVRQLPNALGAKRLGQGVGSAAGQAQRGHWGVGQARELVHIRLVVWGPVDVGVLHHPASRCWLAGRQQSAVLECQPVVGGPPCPCPPGPVLAGGPGSVGGPLDGGVTLVGGAETLGGDAWPVPWASALAPAATARQ